MNPSAMHALLLHGCLGSVQRHPPQPSDVMFTSREAHYSPMPNGGLTTWTAARAFNATRIDWIYSTNATFMSVAHQHNYTVSATINANLADPGAGTYLIGRIQNIFGQPIGAPWMRTWKNPPNYGCINNPGYRRIAFDFATKLLDVGADTIQHDDPATNGGAVLWDNGNISSSGCYCSHCMAKFTTYLLSGLNQTERSRLNVTASFRYKDLLLSDEADNKKLPELRQMFVQFQKLSTEQYILDLRSHVNNHSGREVAMSSNNGDGKWTTPYHLFDYGMGELTKSAATPPSLEAVLAADVPAGKMQVVTMPKEANITAQDVLLTRWAIGFGYALGGHVLVPWDIYLPTPDAKRFYGRPADFADLYSFIRASATLLDGMVRCDEGDARRYIKGYSLTHTGVTGDGQRYRLPTDVGHNIRGNVTHLVGGADACAFACDMHADCRGIFVSTKYRECGLLADLIVTDTYLEGQSYVRKSEHGHRHGHGHAAERGGEAGDSGDGAARVVGDDVAEPFPTGSGPGQMALCNDTKVNVVVRRPNPNAALSSAWTAGWTFPVVVHLVDFSTTTQYDRAASKSRDGSVVELALSNHAIFGRALDPADCSWPFRNASMSMQLLVPSREAVVVKVIACNSAGNTTVVHIPQSTLDPWAILKIGPVPS